MNIKFIYFDVGGVVIKDFSNTNKWNEFMEGLGIKPSDYERFDRFWKGLKVSVRDEMEPIVPLINEEFGVDLPKGYDLLADFVNRFEKNESIWLVVKKAKEKYGVGLLTNMYPGMLGLIERRGLMPNVKWDTIIDSSVEKVLKPQREIFDLARERAGVDAREILFVENSKSHIDAAKSFGWQTFLYDSSNARESSRELYKIL